MNRYPQEPFALLGLVGEFPLILSSGTLCLKIQELTPKPAATGTNQIIFTDLDVTLSNLSGEDLSSFLLWYSFCLLVSFSKVRFGFHLGMEKGKMAIIIRIKLKLKTQGMSIYFEFFKMHQTPTVFAGQGRQYLIQTLPHTQPGFIAEVAHESWHHFLLNPGRSWPQDPYHFPKKLPSII